jgi:hypothetical protein
MTFVQCHRLAHILFFVYIILYMYYFVPRLSILHFTYYILVNFKIYVRVNLPICVCMTPDNGDQSEHVDFVINDSI